MLCTWSRSPVQLMDWGLSCRGRIRKMPRRCLDRWWCLCCLFHTNWNHTKWRGIVYLRTATHAQVHYAAENDSVSRLPSLPLLTDFRGQRGIILHHHWIQGKERITTMDGCARYRCIKQSTKYYCCRRPKFQTISFFKDAIQGDDAENNNAETETGTADWAWQYDCGECRRWLRRTEDRGVGMIVRSWIVADLQEWICHFSSSAPSFSTTFYLLANWI